MQIIQSQTCYPPIPWNTCLQKQSVTDRKMDGQKYDGQSDPYVGLCFAGATKKGVTS